MRIYAHKGTLGSKGRTFLHINAQSYNYLKYLIIFSYHKPLKPSFSTQKPVSDTNEKGCRMSAVSLPYRGASRCYKYPPPPPKGGVQNITAYLPKADRPFCFQFRYPAEQEAKTWVRPLAAQRLCYTFLTFDKKLSSQPFNFEIFIHGIKKLSTAGITQNFFMPEQLTSDIAAALFLISYPRYLQHILLPQAHFPRKPKWGQSILTFKFYTFESVCFSV